MNDIASPIGETASPVLELRQYTVRPGTRDTLIELFDAEFIESQEALGSRILGQFRDQDDPERFVWLRGFPDLATRLEALTAFYVRSDTWRRHAAAARATMIDTTDVLLLRPLRDSGIRPPGHRPPRAAPEMPGTRFQTTVYHPGIPVDEFGDFFDHRVRPALSAAGIDPIGCYQTEPAPNDFPALPIREGETVFVWFARFADERERADRLDALTRTALWQRNIRPELDKRLTTAEQVLRLAPTARSELR